MKCHYEVLSIDRDAGDDDIKRSYKKLALKWHPDKNPENLEECTSQFHLIQQAYEVLIDPQERAWYDKHREAILRGGLGHGDDYKDDSLDVFQYFNTSCFSGYGDDEDGFYAVYNQVFQQVFSEDVEYMDEKDKEDLKAPEFGYSESSYEEVVGVFYGYWESYCTAKSYVWVEKYDTREAPNRQYRRLMEQENKKIRDKAKKERNDQVRALVAFVRKRDKRVQAYKKKLEERAVEIAKLTEEKKQKQKEERLKQFESFKETEWSAMSGLEDGLKQLESKLQQEFGDKDQAQAAGGDSAEEDLEEEDIFDSLFCVACNKAFKTEKAFANHEKSKKHKENVAFLRAELQEEDALYDGLSLSDLNLDEPPEDIPESKQKLSKKQKKKRKQQQQMQEDMDEIADELENSVKENEEQNGPDVTHEETGSKQVNNDCDKDIDESTEACGADNSQDASDVTADADSTQSPEIEMSPAEPQTDTDKPSKGKQGNKQSTAPSSQKSGENLICNVCSASFKSRNQLFKHVNDLGHALRLSDEAPTPEASTKAKNKKKKGKR